MRRLHQLLDLMEVLVVVVVAVLEVVILAQIETWILIMTDSDGAFYRHPQPLFYDRTI